MMNLVLIGIIVGLIGYVVKLQVSNKDLAQEARVNNAMAEHYYEGCKELEETVKALNEEVDFLNKHMEFIEEAKARKVAKLEDYIKCLQKQCSEYATEHLTSLADMVGEITGTSIAMYKEVNEKPVFEGDANLYLGFEEEDKNFGSCFGYGEYEGKNVSIIGINVVEHFDEQDFWIIDYLNKEFSVNLVPNAKTMYTFTLLHEMGHYMDSINYEDINDFHNRDEEQYNKLKTMEFNEERWLAYRKVTGEFNADKWAIEFMIKYLPELAYGNR